MSTSASEIVDSMTAAPAVPSTVTTPLAESGAPPAPTPQEDPKLASRLEIILRREREASAIEKRAKDLEASLQEKLQLIERFEQAKKGNSKQALELLGLNYDQLSQSILQDGSIPAEVKIKELEGKITDLDKRRELDLKREDENKKTLQAQAETHAINSFKEEINTYLTDNKARYELIEFEANQELVFDVVDEHYKRTLDPETGIGKVMSIKEAADKVEEFLEKKYDKAKQVGKVKTLWGAIPKSQQETLAKQFTTKSTQPKTLTNQMSATPQVRPTRPPEEQRVKGILAEFLAKRGQ